jgi:hypothetical protein
MWHQATLSPVFQPDPSDPGSIRQPNGGWGLRINQTCEKTPPANRRHLVYSVFPFLNCVAWFLF